MSAFNLVRASARCPQCKRLVEVRAQFKYGNTWQYEYHVGEKLRWGGNDVGEAGHKRVVVDAIAEGPCPNCGYDEEWNLYVDVVYDQIAQVETTSGEYDFSRAGRPYIVIEE
jgi:endogenous inhibitor of DNA gyrase (YacG/DUF329 family)